MRIDDLNQPGILRLISLALLPWFLIASNAGAQSSTELKTSGWTDWEVEGLLAALADPAESTQLNTLQMLALEGRPFRDARLVSRIGEDLESNDEDTVLAAVAALEVAGIAATALTASVRAQIQPEQADLNAAAITTLSAISIKPDQDLAGLDEQLRHSDQGVRRAMLSALARHPEVAVSMHSTLLAMADGQQLLAAGTGIGTESQAIGVALGQLAKRRPDLVLPWLQKVLDAASPNGEGAAISKRIAVVAILSSADQWTEPDKLAPLLRALIAPMRQRMQNRLGGVSSGRQVLAARLRSLEERNAVMAAVALQLLDPDDSDNRAFVSREIKGNHYNSILSALSLLPAQLDLRLTRQVVAEFAALAENRVTPEEEQQLLALLREQASLRAELQGWLRSRQQAIRIEALSLLSQLSTLEGISAELIADLVRPAMPTPDDQLEQALVRLLQARLGLHSERMSDELVAALQAGTTDKAASMMLLALAETGLPASWRTADSERFLLNAATAQSMTRALVRTAPQDASLRAQWLEWASQQRDYLSWRPEARAAGLDLAEALRALGPLTRAEELRPFLSACIRWTERCDGLRSLAYRMFGHDARSRMLISELSDHDDHDVRNDRWLAEQAKRTRIEAMASVLGPALEADRSKRRLYAEVARKGLNLINRETWSAADAPPLLQFRQALASAGEIAYAEQVDRTLRSITATNYLKLAGLLLLAHALIWAIVIALYPFWSALLGPVLWNPWIRGYLGLGYVGFLIRSIPPLSTWMFRPFRAALVPPGALSGFQAQSYYRHCEMRPVRGPAQAPVAVDSVLRIVRGRVVLQGASGLGKTTLLRHLAEQGAQTMMLLRALDCKEGVMRAIQFRLPMAAKDPAFLSQLITGGALVLLIDGLNEASPDSRARIDHFLQADYRGHFLLTTQPLNWEPPPLAEVYDLLPLDASAIEAFLIQQWPSLKTVQANQEQFERDAREFISALRAAVTRGDELAEARLHALCNPMEAVLAAELLAKGQRPETGRMLGQFFALMRADFERIENREFPDAALAERVFQWRLSGTPFIDMSTFEREAEQMRQHKLLRRREEELHTADGQKRLDAVWQFRHDRIMDYALLPAFLGEHQDRQFKHWQDARFNGVYDLLIEALPLEQARQLVAFLQDRATESNDSALCLRLTAILREREGSLLGSIEQDYLLTLEQIQQLASLDAATAQARIDEFDQHLQRLLARVDGSPFVRRSDIQRTLAALRSGQIWKRPLKAAPASAEATSDARHFDVFLSHNSKDKPAVRALASALKADGFKVWYDEWELVPGRPIQEALEAAMLDCRTAAVLVGADGFGPWEVPEMRGFLALAVERQLPVIPVLLPGSPAKPALPLFLKQFLWVDLRQGLSGTPYERLRWGITGIRPEAVTT